MLRSGKTKLVIVFDALKYAREKLDVVCRVIGLSLHVADTPWVFSSGVQKGSQRYELGTVN
jgi:hypothetical protein